MTDPIDYLRARNPVDTASLEIPAPLALRAITPPPPPRHSGRWLAAAATAVVAVIAGVLLVSGPATTVNAAARAYAAVAPGTGVTHWRTETTNPGGQRQVTEGWATSTVTHAVDYFVVDGHPKLVDDVLTADGHQTVWTAGTGETRAAPYHVDPKNFDSGAGGLDPGQDPATSLRLAYEAHVLHQVDPTTLTIDMPPCCTGTYHLDPDTGVPTQYVVTRNPADIGPTTMDITTYQHLPATAENLKRLDPLPHPVLKQLGTAREMFAALREGAPPSGADRVHLKSWMSNAGPDNGWPMTIDDVRPLGNDAYLVPAGDHLCIAIVGSLGTGASCTTLSYAERHGVEVDGTMAVPDGITAVDITNSDGTHTIDRVKNGTATIIGDLSSGYELK